MGLLSSNDVGSPMHRTDKQNRQTKMVISERSGSWCPGGPHGPVNQGALGSQLGSAGGEVAQRALARNRADMSNQKLGRR